MKIFDSLWMWVGILVFVLRCVRAEPIPRPLPNPDPEAAANPAPAPPGIPDLPSLLDAPGKYIPINLSPHHENKPDNKDEAPKSHAAPHEPMRPLVNTYPAPKFKNKNLNKFLTQNAPPQPPHTSYPLPRAPNYTGAPPPSPTQVDPPVEPKPDLLTRIALTDKPSHHTAKLYWDGHCPAFTIPVISKFLLHESGNIFGELVSPAHNHARCITLHSDRIGAVLLQRDSKDQPRPNLALWFNRSCGGRPDGWASLKPGETKRCLKGFERLGTWPGSVMFWEGNERIPDENMTRENPISLGERGRKQYTFDE